MLRLFQRSARVCRRTDPRRVHNMASLTHSTLLSVWAKSGRPCGLLSFVDPSWYHFNTHNTIVLRQGALCLWNCWQQPWCVAVSNSVFINNSTAALWCCTDHRSLSTKLQTSLDMMTVSMEVTHRGHAGFQISKTIRCFWHILYYTKNCSVSSWSSACALYCSNDSVTTLYKRKVKGTFNINHVLYNILTIHYSLQLTASVTINNYLFCDAPPTCFGTYKAFSGTSFTKQYIYNRYCQRSVYYTYGIEIQWYKLQYC